MRSGLPKEHGATVMSAAALLVGLGTGISAAGPADGASLGLMAAAVVGLFLVREPVGLLWKRDRPLGEQAQRDAKVVLAVALVLAAVGGLGALARLPLGGLLAVGAVGLPLLALALWTRVARREREAWAELLGVIALALPAAAMHFAGTGVLGLDALRPFSACLLFYVGSTMHLRVLWRDRKAARKGAEVRELHWLWSVAAVAVGVGLWALGWFGAWTAAGFAVALLRPALVRGQLLTRPVQVGFLESLLTLAFTVAVVLDAAR